MARQIVVEIVGDASKFSKSTDDAIGKTESLGGKLKGVGKGMVIGAGIGAFNLLTDAVAMGVSMLGDAHDAFLADDKSQKMLAQSLKNNIPNWDGNTKGAEEFAAAQGRLGFADDDVRASLAQLVGITHDVTKAQDLSSIAMDLSRAKGIDLASATDIVTKAAQGNGKALKSLGIDIGGATDAAGMLDAIQKNVAGSAETWANTNEGKLAVSNVKVGEAMEKVGAVVDTVAQVVMPIFADALTAIMDVLGALWAAIQPVIDQLVQGLQPAFQEMSPVLTALGETFGAVFGFIGEVVGKAVSGIMIIWDKFGSNIMEGVKIAFNYIKNSIQNALKVVQGIFDVFSGIFSGDWDKVWKGVKEIFTGIWNQIKNAFDTVVGIIKNVLDAFGKAVGSIWNNITKTVGDRIKDFVGFFTGLPKKIGDAVGGLFDGIPKAFKAALNFLIKMWNNLKFTLGPFDLGPMGSIGPWSLSTPNLPYFHSGGVVPGAPGSDVLAVLQAGERVIPRSQAGGSGFTIIVNGDVYGDGIDQLADKLALRLRLAGA